MAATVKQKTAVRNGSVGGAKQDPASHGKPTKKDHQTPTSKFGEAFTQSQEAFDELLKTGSLSTDEVKRWDKDLASFFAYQNTVRNNPGQRFTIAKLFPNAPIMHSRKPPPIITLDEGDQGPPPPPKPEPEKKRPPLPPKIPKTPLPKMPPQPHHHKNNRKSRPCPHRQQAHQNQTRSRQKKP